MTGYLHRDRVTPIPKPQRKEKPKRKGWPRRKKQVPLPVRNALFARSDGRCEAQVQGVCWGRAVDPHHVRRRSQGGDDSLDNLLAVCRPCHRWVHANVARSLILGFLRSAA